MYFVKYDEQTDYLMVHAHPFDERFGLGKTYEELEKEGYFVSSLPMKENIEGMVAELKFNVNTRQLYYEYFPRPLTQEEELQIIKSSMKSETQLYEEIKNNTNSTFEDLRTARIEKLKEEATGAIYNGFTSQSTGHTFGFNSHDQQNFDQYYLLVVSGDNAGADIQWKSKDSGVVTLTEAEFRTVILESKNHKLTQQQKYWTFEAQILSATTKDEIIAVVW